MSRTDDATQDALRDQILNFLSLSSDIALNQHDADFSDQGGQIIYCLDQTIFNLFFDTRKWRHAVSSFYERSWAVPGRNRREGVEQWERIQAQSALIASEYLLSEELPAAKNRNIYLTPWHRHELAIRLKRIAGEIEEGKVDTKKIADEVRRKLDFLSGSRLDRNSGQGGLFEPDPLLEGDLDSLRPDMPDLEALKRYELTRRAATMLVDCEASERFDQVHRLVSRPLRQRLKSLHQLFPPAESDLAALALDARKWHLRILGEAQRSRSHRSPGRSPGGVWNDARSLAFVRWAAAKVRRDQRLVLITSDDTLFATYRRWWCDEGTAEEGHSEPFLLRRSFQYTPIFNFRDSKNDLSRSGTSGQELENLFSKISQAVHLTLLPFNLFQTGSGIGNLAQNKNFQYMALRERERRHGETDTVLDYYLSRFPPEFYRNRVNEIGEITELWRNIERIGIGFFYDQVVKRLEDDRYLFGIDDASEASPENVERALRYLSRVLDTITSRTRSAYLPLAESFLAEFDTPVTGAGRAPDTLWYQIAGRGSVYQLMTTWHKMKPRDRQESIRDLNKSPEALFVFAAAFALAVEEWWRAEEFARYALEAARASDHTAPRVRAELLFLCAFTKRFRLGSSGLAETPGESAGRDQRVRSSFRRSEELSADAEALLDQYHETTAGLAPAQEGRLYQMRGRSERAALRLSMALHGALRAPETRDVAVVEALENVRKAKDDIVECARLDTTVTARELRDRQERVRRHFVHNAAAVEVCRFLLTPRDEFQLDAGIAAVVDRFATLAYRQISETDVIVNAERIVFAILHGNADAREWPQLESALARLKESGLTLDRLYANALSNRTEELFSLLTEQGASAAVELPA
jgi:hypothetical protein